MTNPNESTMKTFPLQPGDDSVMSVSSHPKRKATWHRTAVRLAAWFEIIVGASFLFALNAQSQLIFGATVEGVGVPFAQLAGIGLIGLGLACMPSNLTGMYRSAVPSLLIFNIAVTILFAWVAVATPYRGVILWPVVSVHAIIAIALALSLRHEDS